MYFLQNSIDSQRLTRLSFYNASEKCVRCANIRLILPRDIRTESPEAFPTFIYVMSTNQTVIHARHVTLTS